MDEQQALLKSIKNLEIAHLCGTVASYWTSFIAIASIVGMIFLPVSESLPLALVTLPYFALRLSVIILARLFLGLTGFTGGRLYLAAVAAKSIACKEESNRIIGTLLITAVTATLLYLASITYGELTIYFSLVALVMANAGIYMWFIYPYCFAYGAVSLTLISIPYALFELYVVKPSPMHLFATMTITDVLAILGIVTVGVKKCQSARR